MSPKAERNNYSRVKSNNKTQTRKANEISSNTKVAQKLQDLKKPVYNKVLKKRWFSTPNKRDLTSLLDKGNNLDITTT